MLDVTMTQTLRIAKALMQRAKDDKTVLVSELINSKGEEIRLRYAYTGDFIISDDTGWDKYRAGYTDQSAKYCIIKPIKGESNEDTVTRVLRVWLNFKGEYFGAGIVKL